MATADQVKALVRSHAAGDESHFYSVALQVAARAAKSGQSKVAQELSDLVDEAKAGAARPGRLVCSLSATPSSASLTSPWRRLCGSVSSGC